MRTRAQKPPPSPPVSASFGLNTRFSSRYWEEGRTKAEIVRKLNRLVNTVSVRILKVKAYLEGADNGNDSRISTPTPLNEIIPCGMNVRIGVSGMDIARCETIPFRIAPQSGKSRQRRGSHHYS